MKNKILRFFFGYEYPINLYEQCPALAWLVICGVIAYGILGCFVIF
jgi:hypothetical protein